MASEPVLDIFCISVKRKKNRPESCFRDLFKKKFNVLNVSDEELFKKFIGNFISGLNDIDGCYKIEGTKKILTIKPQDNNGYEYQFDPRFKPDLNNFLFSGVIHGGKYREKRFTIPIENKNEQRELPNNIALTREFFFMLHLPMNSNRGILIVQSYTGSSYHSHLTYYLSKELLSNVEYCNTRYDSIYLKSIRDSIKERSYTKSLTYYKKTELGSRVGNNDEQMILGRFKVTVNIQPIEDEICSLDDFDNAFKELAENETLDNWEKKATINDIESGKNRSYFLSNENSLKPKILLSDFITVSNEGDFSVNEVYLYCKEIIPEVIQMINN